LRQRDVPGDSQALFHTFKETNDQTEVSGLVRRGSRPEQPLARPGRPQPERSQQRHLVPQFALQGREGVPRRRRVQPHRPLRAAPTACGRGAAAPAACGTASAAPAAPAVETHPQAAAIRLALFGALIAFIVLKEQLMPLRIVAACGIAAGAILLRLA